MGKCSQTVFIVILYVPRIVYVILDSIPCLEEDGINLYLMSVKGVNRNITVVLIDTDMMYEMK